MKRVVFLAQHTPPVDERVPPHGSGAHVAASLAGLRTSFEVLPLFAPDEETGPSSPHVRRSRVLVPSRVRGLRQDLLTMRADRAFAGRALAVARDFHPDVVYGRSEYLSRAPERVSRALSVPLVLEVNGLLHADVRTMYRSLAEPVSSAIERRKLVSADAIVTVSRGLADRIVAAGAEPSRVSVVPNAVPDDRVVAAPATRAHASVVGWIGHLMSWHAEALLMLVNAAPAVLERVPHARFRVVGEGPRLDEVRSLARSLAVSDAFEFTGRVPYDAVPRTLASFDIGVIPNVFDYAFPVKLVEYGAAGLAVAAPQSEELDSMLQPDVEYLPFARGDTQALSAAIIELLTNDARRYGLAQALHSAVRERYTWSRAADLLRAVIDNAMTSRRVSS